MQPSLGVMAGLVPAIHALPLRHGKKGVDARDKRGHDDCATQFASAVSRRRPVVAVTSSRNVTLTAMSGRMRGSFWRNPTRTRTVAFSRLAVGTMAMT